MRPLTLTRSFWAGQSEVKLRFSSAGHRKPGTLRARDSLGKRKRNVLMATANRSYYRHFAALRCRATVRPWALQPSPGFAACSAMPSRSAAAATNTAVSASRRSMFACVAMGCYIASPAARPATTRRKTRRTPRARLPAASRPAVWSLLAVSASFAVYGFLEGRKTAKNRKAPHAETHYRSMPETVSILGCFASSVCFLRW